MAATLVRFGRRMTCAFLPLGSGKFVWHLGGLVEGHWSYMSHEDAFDTESDALDYCNDLLLEDTRSAQFESTSTKLW